MARHNISSLSSRIRTLPPIARRQTTVGRELDSRDQTRRLSADGPARSHGHPTADPPRQRLVQPLPANRGGCEPPQGEVLPHRWRAVPTCGGSPSRFASGTRQHPAQKRAWGAPSMSTLSTLMALKCSTTPAGWGWKGSFRSGWDRATGLAAHRTGSSLRTRKRLR